MKYILRWILVLPAGAGAAGAVVVFNLLVPKTTLLDALGTDLVNSVFQPLAFILAATYAAPKFNREVSIAAAVLWVGAIALLTGIEWNEINPDGFRWGIFRSLLSLATAIGTAVIYCREHPEMPKPQPAETVTFGKN